MQVLAIFKDHIELFLRILPTQSPREHLHDYHLLFLLDQLLSKAAICCMQPNQLIFNEQKLSKLMTNAWTDPRSSTRCCPAIIAGKHGDATGECVNWTAIRLRTLFLLPLIFFYHLSKPFSIFRPTIPCGWRVAMVW